MVVSPTPGNSAHRHWSCVMETNCPGHLSHREALMMKSSAIFVSLLVTGESLTCTGSDDLPNSVAFYYQDSDLGGNGRCEDGQLRR